MNARRVVALAWLAAATGAGAAELPAPIATAASATVHAVQRADKAVTHAAKVAASGVEKGVRKAGQAVSHVAHEIARRVGVPASGAASSAGTSSGSGMHGR